MASGRADRRVREAKRRLKIGAGATVAGAEVFTLVAVLPGADHLTPHLYWLLLLSALIGDMLLGTIILFRRRAGKSFPGYLWALLDIALVSAAVALTGGEASNMYLIYVGTLLFAAAFYPLRPQILLWAATSAGYLSAVLVTHGVTSVPLLFVRSSALGLATAIAACQAGEKSHIAAESERRADLLRAVAAAAKELTVLEADKVFGSVTAVMEQVGFELSHISLIDEEAGVYRIVHSNNVPPEYTSITPPANAGLVGRVRASRSTVTLDEDELRDYMVPLLNVHWPFTAMIGSPLWVEGSVAGVLAGASYNPNGVPPEEVEAVELLAGVVGRALEASARFSRVTETAARDHFQAYHDELTGLANRSLLHQRLRDALALGPGQQDRQVGLVHIDLYDFKLVNDAIGQRAGDELLVTIGARVASSLGQGGTAGRVAGDEFALVVPCTSRDQLDDMARTLLETIAAPVDIAGQSVSVDASIGIAMRTADATNEKEQEQAADEVLRNVDVASYEAKRLGKQSHAIFNQSMAEGVKERMAIAAELPRAVESGDMVVYYQPIFELASRKVKGFEALLRWRHPRLGVVSPVRFIPLAEETGAILPIGRWVLRQACAQLRSLHTASPDWAGLTMSINLSARQLRDPHLVDDVAETLRVTSLNPSQLTLEITESSLLQDAAGGQSRVAALSALGVRIALDDFGTGYSSLSYLHQLQVHCLKIDKSFVAGIEESGTNRREPALVRTIADLSSALGLDTIAEGIETEGQLAKLLSLGCYLGQGFVFAPALPPGDLPGLLSANRSPVGTSVVG